MRRLPLLLGCLLAACATPAARPGAPGGAPAAAAPAQAPATTTAPREQRYEVLMAGNPAGAMVVTRRGADERDVALEYNDRGRGPKQQLHVAFDERGLPRALEQSGVDYLKAPLSERLEAGKGGLSWSNGAETGSSAAPGFYISFYGPPELDAALVRALLRAPGQRLALLPAGEARVEKGSDRTVAGDGGKLHVTRYDVSGLSFDPGSIWLDDEGELFAEGTEWFAVVRPGYRSALPELFADQDAAEEQLLRRVAAATAQPLPAAGLALVNARIFDPASRSATLGTVLVQGDRIAAVGSKVQVPAGARVIDLAGKTVLPGLWDMHVHVSPIDGLLHLAAGVTSVRDLANDHEVLERLRRSWDAGETVGPRLVRAGFIDGRGPYQGPTKVFADNEAEAVAAVNQYADRGYVQIKVYSSLAPKLVAPIVAAAHTRGLRVSGHVPSGMLASDFVRAGVDEIQHVNFLLLEFLATRDDDTRTPLRFTRIAEKAAGLDLSSRPVQELLTLLRERQVVVDPTVTAIGQMMIDRRGAISAALAHAAPRLPVQVRRGALAGGLPVPDGMDATYLASGRKLLEMVKALHDAGVTLVAGTDGLAGFTLHHELEQYVAAGIPAPEVLALATLGAARVARRDAELGTLAPGKLADLIVVDGKPDQSIDDLERVQWVLKGGVLRDAQKLYEAVGVGAWK